MIYRYHFINIVWKVYFSILQTVLSYLPWFLSLNFSTDASVGGFSYVEAQKITKTKQPSTPFSIDSLRQILQLVYVSFYFVDEHNIFEEIIS